MAKTASRNLTTGSPTRLVIGFLLPLLGGLLFQQLYNLVDTMIVGKLLGAQALAAVGSMLYFTTYPAIVPTAGAMPGLKAFVAAVFGGIGSIPGAVVGAFLIGLCEEIIKGLGQSTFSDAFTFALLIIVLCVKPTGLFGEKVTDKV